jgi:hypothetical protein
VAIRRNQQHGASSHKHTGDGSLIVDGRLRVGELECSSAQPEDNALFVRGGAYIGKDITSKGTISAEKTITHSSSAMFGNFDIAKLSELTVAKEARVATGIIENDLTVKGNLTVKGTMTSTNVIHRDIVREGSLFIGSHTIANDHPSGVSIARVPTADEPVAERGNYMITTNGADTQMKIALTTTNDDQSTLLDADHTGWLIVIGDEARRIVEYDQVAHVATLDAPLSPLGVSYSAGKYEAYSNCYASLAYSPRADRFIIGYNNSRDLGSLTSLTDLQLRSLLVGKTRLAAANSSVPREITLPDASGTLALSSRAHFDSGALVIKDDQGNKLKVTTNALIINGRRLMLPVAVASDDSLVSQTAEQELSSKTIKGLRVRSGDSSATATFEFDPRSTDLHLTWPSSSTQLSGLDTQDILTNKTLIHESNQVAASHLMVNGQVIQLGTATGTTDVAAASSYQALCLDEATSIASFVPIGGRCIVMAGDKIKLPQARGSFILLISSIEDGGCCATVTLSRARAVDSGRVFIMTMAKAIDGTTLDIQWPSGSMPVLTERRPKDTCSPLIWSYSVGIRD